jgi:plastocyanin
MKRREFVTGVLVGGAAIEALAAQGHDHGKEIDGPLANATVSFGAWPTEPPFDRIAAPPPGPPRNVHELIPYTATIKAGGTVNFVIAGVHVVAVYGPGSTFESVDGSITMPLPGAPAGFPPVINDSVNRIYRGANPVMLSQDRTEVVHFDEPGTYLVICAFQPHFLERMHGWVKVVR